MAKRAIPNPLERRHVIERELAADAALRLADAYLAEGRAWDAIGFLEKAGARDRLAALREHAIGEGDYFLVREISRVLGEDPGAARWRAVAAAATTAGKDRFAAEALRQAVRAEG
jgi:hypothetical protein